LITLRQLLKGLADDSPCGMSKYVADLLTHGVCVCVCVCVCIFVHVKLIVYINGLFYVHAAVCPVHCQNGSLVAELNLVYLPGDLIFLNWVMVQEGQTNSHSCPVLYL
jgi:hypothetical protein